MDSRRREPHDHPMTNTPDDPLEGEPQLPGPADTGPDPSDEPGPTKNRSTRHTTELRRPKQGRMVAGVAAGIADRLGIERWIVRLAFVLLSAGGGSGVLLYVAAWLLMPEEGEPVSVGQRWANQANGARPWVGVVLVLIAAAILFSNLPFFDGGLLFPTALLVIGILLYRGDLPGIEWKAKPRDATTGAPTHMEMNTAMTTTSDSTTATLVTTPVVSKPRTPPSPLGRITVGVAIIGLGLLAAIDRITPAIDAEPRHYFALAVTILGLGILTGTYLGKARWLIPIGLLLVPPLIGTAVADAYEGSSAWQTPQVIRPLQFASLAPMYERGAGDLLIDLTDLPWNGEAIILGAELGVGQLELRVPAGVGVEARGDIGIGEFATDGNAHGGLGVDRTFTLEGAGAGTVVANLSVGIGQILVDTHGGRLFDGAKPIGGDDQVIDVNSTEALEGSYSAGTGDLTVDLADLVLTSDRTVAIASDIGDISVILPIDASYRIVARTDFGVVDLFGEDQVDRGGSVRADSITSGPVIELDIQSIEGDIILIKGERE
jgi:phage shock protein PspC (stress-responsive transcriptional regulator)/predicted membrane protein